MHFFLKKKKGKKTWQQIYTNPNITVKSFMELPRHSKNLYMIMSNDTNRSA